MNFMLLTAVVIGGAANEELTATPQRSDTTVRVVRGDNSVILDIHSKSGIGQAVIQPRTDAWPQRVEVRLHLPGLESFRVECEEVVLELSVSSSDPMRQQISLRDADRSQQSLDKQSPYWTNVQFEGTKPTIPLPADAYFSIRLPRKLFEANPKSLRLAWVDFFRN